METKKMIIVVPGEPVGKGRPRFARRGNYISTYTPEKTKVYESFVRMCFLKADKKETFAEGEPLRVCIYAYCGIPKSTTKTKAKDMLEGKIRPAKKPDVDNIAKIILDALDGLAYKDDKQVVELLVSKRYAEEPSVLVELTEIK